MVKVNDINSIDYFVLPEEQRETYTCFFNEIWNDQEYNRFGVGINAGDIVLDCGASIGLFSLYALNMGAKRVFAFEMNEALIPYFVTNTSGFHGITLENTKVGQDGTTFEDIFLRHGLHGVDFAKVDIEGSEYDLILNMEPVILRKVRKWAIEVHNWGMFRNDNTESLKILSLIEKFSTNGFKCYYEHIHKKHKSWYDLCYKGIKNQPT